MNEIDYKEKGERRYKRYVGLGGWDITNIYSLPEFNDMCGWKTFLSEEVDSFLINIYCLILLDYKEYIEGEVGDNIKKNIDKIKTIVEKWFYPESSLFIYPDFTLEGTTDEVEEYKFNRYGQVLSVKFKYGSKLRLLEPDDSWEQMFVIKPRYEELISDFQQLTAIFK